MSDAILYQYEISPFCDKVRRALTFKGIAFRCVNVSVAETLRGKVKALNPAAKLPVLEIDGQSLCDSTDILQWLEAHYPEPALLQVDPALRAEAWLLEDWADESLYFYEVRLRFMQPANARHWVAAALREDTALMRAVGRLALPASLAKVARAQGVGRKPLAVVLADLNRLLGGLDQRLLQREWLVGDQLSVADISVASQIDCLAVTPEGAQVIDGLPRLQAWRQRVDALTRPA